MKTDMELNAVSQDEHFRLVVDNEYSILYCFVQ